MSADVPHSLINHTYGAELTASYATTALWGIQCLQMFMYFNTYSNDPLIIKILVVWTWLADTVHEVLIICLEYSILVTHYGDFERGIFQIDVELILQGIFTIFVSVPVQLFFLHRIWRLNGNKPLVPLISLVGIILETVTGITYFQWAFHKGATPELILIGTKRVTGVVYLVTAAAVDVIITLSMVSLLRAAQVHGLTQTRRMVTRLIVYSVNTGLWTALLAVVCAITMIFFPKTFVFNGIYLPISSLYCNTLLANLNIRQHVRGLQNIITLQLSAIPSGLQFQGEASNGTVQPVETDTTRTAMVNLHRTPEAKADKPDFYLLLCLKAML